MSGADAVSSPDTGLSSPPKSPRSPDAPSTLPVADNSTIRVLGGGAHLQHPQHHTPATSSKNNTSSPATTANTTASGRERKKPGPKPKPKDPNAPEKKTRKPRKTAEQNEITTAAPTRKKRQTKSEIQAQLIAQAQEREAQARAQAQAEAEAEARRVQILAQQQQQQQQLLLQQQQMQQQQQQPAVEEKPKSLQQAQPAPAPRQSNINDFVTGGTIVVQTPATRMSSNSEALHSNPSLSHINASAAPSTPRPASSGQHYDPVRGSSFEAKPHNAASAPPVSPPFNRASASPSIGSLIDPPSVSHSNYPQTARLQQQQQQQPSVTSAPVSPAAASRPGPAFPSHEPQPQQHPYQQQQQARPSSTLSSMPMEIDSDMNSAPRQSLPMKKTDSSAGTHSAAPTPPGKPQRQKEAPPPLPTGSGLLSGTPFGPMAGANSAPAEPQGVNIWLTIPLKGQNNVSINFAQEVEKKYGFAALHPRIAARQERKRQIHAAGAALEKAAGGGSNDDMSLDVSEPESNVEMGGMDDEASAGNGVKKRRRRKQEDYDKDDDFIDDTELAWEQQALMAKDGFFVYSGPLVTEGEKPAVERADGTVVRPRGRGRGRGGSTRGETSGRGRGRGGGPGSRGGTTVRKPRVTKADRMLMEQEKLEREKMAATLAAKQPLAAAYGPSSHT